MAHVRSHSDFKNCKKIKCIKNKNKKDRKEIREKRFRLYTIKVQNICIFSISFRFVKVTHKKETDGNEIFLSHLHKMIRHTKSVMSSGDD